MKKSKILEDIFLSITVMSLCIIALTWLVIITPQKTPEVTKYTPVPITQDEQQMVWLTNAYRKSHGLSTLSINQQLMDSAQAKADDMCQSGIWSHDNSLDKPFSIFIDAVGYSYGHIGENLSKGYGLDSAFGALVASPRHLDNIIGKYNDIGVGINYCAGKNYIAIHYGSHNR